MLTRYLPDGTQLGLGGQWIGPTRHHRAELVRRHAVRTYPTPGEGATVVDYGGTRLADTPPEATAILDEIDALAGQVHVDQPWATPRARECSLWLHTVPDTVPDVLLGRCGGERGLWRGYRGAVRGWQPRDYTGWRRPRDYAEWWRPCSLSSVVRAPAGAEGVVTDALTGREPPPVRSLYRPAVAPPRCVHGRGERSSTHRGVTDPSVRAERGVGGRDFSRAGRRWSGSRSLLQAQPLGNEST